MTDFIKPVTLPVVPPITPLPLPIPKPNEPLPPAALSALEQQIIFMGNYDRIRTLDDGTIIGVGNLMFTRALYVDLDLWGWRKRYCFEDPALADRAFDALASGDDAVMTGYVASRGT